MPRIAIIDPGKQKVTYTNAEDSEFANHVAGRSDHGIVQRGGAIGYGIFVPEYGLYSATPEYFAIGRILYHGTSVLYAFDEEGRSVTLPNNHPMPRWLGDIAAVEQAITAGEIDRPFMSLNGNVIWRWPDAR
jgi:hypothetical protein